MKKFFMVTPQQGPGKLKAVTYEHQGNRKLAYGDTHFPVIPLINGYSNDNEHVQLITVTYGYDSCKHNLEILKQELSELRESRGILCDLESINVAPDDSVSATLHVFQTLIDWTADDDKLHACITYGSKPMPIVLVMAMQYARRIKNNASFGCVVYGAIDHSGGTPPKIYDVTSLVGMDEVIHMLAENEVAHPEAILRYIIEND